MGTKQFRHHERRFIGQKTDPCFKPREVKLKRNKPVVWYITSTIWYAGICFCTCKLEEIYICILLSSKKFYTYSLNAIWIIIPGITRPLPPSSHYETLCRWNWMLGKCWTHLILWNSVLLQALLVNYLLLAQTLIPTVEADTKWQTLNLLFCGIADKLFPSICEETCRWKVEPLY